MDQSNQNLLKKNFNEWAIFSIINNTKINENPVLGWKIISGEKVTVEVTFYIIRKFKKEIVVRAVSSKAKKQLAELASSANNLNFYLPNDMALFQAEIKQIETNGDLRIAIPTMIAQIDRRKNLRLFVEEGMSIKTIFHKESHGQKVANQLFQKDCFDISAGGLSFVVSKPERKFFLKGDRVNQLKLKMNNIEMEIDAEVINILEIKPSRNNDLHYKGWKICLEFTKIAPKHAKEIEDYVFRYVDFDQAI